MTQEVKWKQEEIKEEEKERIPESNSCVFVDGWKATCDGSQNKHDVEIVKGMLENGSHGDMRLGHGEDEGFPCGKRVTMDSDKRYSRGDM